MKKLSDYLEYPLTIDGSGEDPGFTIVVDGLSGCITESPDEKGIDDWARSVFVDYADAIFHMKKTIPPAPKNRENKRTLKLPVVLALKIMLHNELNTQGISKAELARRLGTSPASIGQSLDLHRTNTNIDSLFRIFATIGIKCDILLEVH